METRLSDHANRPRKTASRRQTAAPTQVPTRVAQPLITPGRLLAIALIVVAAAGITGGGWLGLQLIIKPQSLSWINRFIPGWIPVAVFQAPPQTLADIRADLRRAGMMPGELMSLGKSTSLVDSQSLARDWLLPIYQTVAPIQGSEENIAPPIVELRLYQSAAESATEGEPSYRLVTQLAIAGLEESFVVAPLIDAHSPSQGSSRPLPLTNLSHFEGVVPKSGFWLNLSSRRDWGNDPLAYGQILYYNPAHHHLSVKLQWTSPVGADPVWKETTGGGNPELIVNQTVGMEPDFQMYQVKPLSFVPSPVQLQPISVAEPALDQSMYRNALLLARGRLWSTSLEWLETVRSQLPATQWNREAQAQLDLIRWHAQATATQAESTWASPSQQALANLIDGRWERALMVLETSDEASQEMVGLLKADTGRLETRMRNALQVGTENSALKIWMGLLIAAQKGNPAAIAWLKKQPKTTPAELKTMNALLQRMAR